MLRTPVGKMPGSDEGNLFLAFIAPIGASTQRDLNLVAVLVVRMEFLRFRNPRKLITENATVPNMARMIKKINKCSTLPSYSHTL